MKNSESILLVEDDNVDAMMTQRALNDLKITNKMVRKVDGKDALDYLRDETAQKPCVILLDLNMPRMDGFEFLKVIKTEPRLKRIPVVVLTTSDADQSVVESYDLGVAGYIVKPVDYKQFVEAMRILDLYWTLNKLPNADQTAYAKKGDDQKCIEAGCDDFLAKPIDHRELLTKNSKYLPSETKALSKTIDSVKSQADELTDLCLNETSQESDSEGMPCTEVSEEIINWDQLIDRLGDEELINEIVLPFLKDNKERIEKLSEAVKSKDSKAIKFYAHAIKGAARNVGAKRLSDTACQMECAGRENDMAVATPLFDELKSELEKVVTFLSRPDWVEIAQMEKADTGERFNNNTIC